MASGVLIESIYLIDRMERAIGNGPENVTDFLQSHLTYELSLTDDQQKQLAVILGNSKDKVIAIRTRVAPEIQGILLDTKQQIEKILTPDQLKKFNEQMELAKDHFSKSPFFPNQTNNANNK